MFDSDDPSVLFQFTNNPETCFAFVDIDNVRCGLDRALRTFGIPDASWADFDLLSLFRSFRNIRRYYLYSSVAPDEAVPEWIATLRAQPGFIFRQTRLIEKGGARKQEGVDVNLAVEAMQCVHRRTMNRVLIWSDDGDLLPLIDAIVSEGVTVGVVSFNNPEKSDVAARQRDSADQYFRIGRRTLLSAFNRLQSNCSNVMSSDEYEALPLRGERQLGGTNYLCYDHPDYGFIVRDNARTPSGFFWRGFPDEKSADSWIRLNQNTLHPNGT